MDSSAETDCVAHEQCDSDSSDDSMENIFPNLSLVLFGNSSSVQFGHENILLGEEQTNTENAEIPRIVPVQRNISEHHMSVINMIDLQEIETVDHAINQLMEEKEIHAFIFVVRLGQLTDADKMGLNWLQIMFGDQVLQFVMILFTYETEEECKTVIDVKKNPILEQLLEKCGGRFDTCNMMMNNQLEMRELMKKIEHLFNWNQQQSYTGEMYNTAIKQREKLERKRECQRDGGKIRGINVIIPNAADKQQTAVSSLSSRRIVLLGKTGVGKSSAGNTILGHKVFESVMSMKSVTSQCSDAHATVSGRSVSVVDTPGFFDTEMNTEELAVEIARSVYLSSPGPHAFLIVFPLNIKFTKQEQQIPEKIEMMFGQEVLKYSIILFTHGDLLEGKPVEEIIKENSRLSCLVDQCGGRFHVFANRDQNNREQVNDLLQKIGTMIEQNGGGHYSNQMFEDAHRFRQEEEELRQREEKERKQQEEEQRQEIDRVRKEAEKIREEMEAKRCELERLEDKRQREEEERKQQEEKQRQELIERVRTETEKIRAELEAERSELERLKAERQREEEWRRRQEEKQTQEEIERARARIRAEIEDKISELERLKEEEKRKVQEKKKRQEERIKAEKETIHGFGAFCTKHRHVFVAAAVGVAVVAPIAGGFAAVGAAAAGAAVFAAKAFTVGAAVGAAFGVAGEALDDGADGTQSSQRKEQERKQD